MKTIMRLMILCALVCTLVSLLPLATAWGMVPSNVWKGKQEAGVDGLFSGEPTACVYEEADSQGYLTAEEDVDYDEPLQGAEQAVSSACVKKDECLSRQEEMERFMRLLTKKHDYSEIIDSKNCRLSKDVPTPSCIIL